MTYDIDIEKLTKSAYDTYNVCALMGCLVNAIWYKNDGSIATDEDKFLWQLKGSIEIAEGVLDNASTTFFELLEIIDCEERQHSVVKGQGEADTP